MQTASFIYLLILFVLLIPAMLYALRRKDAMMNIVVWVAVFAGLMWGYTLYTQRTGDDPMATPATLGQQAPQTDTAEPEQEPAPATDDSADGPVRHL